MKIFAVVVATVSKYYDYKDQHPEHDQHQIAWFKEQHEKGTLLCCGPFLPPDGTGIWLLRAENLDEAKEIAASSPRAKDGLLSPGTRIVEWGVHIGEGLIDKKQP